jgi:NADPH2:quinone reductase
MGGDNLWRSREALREGGRAVVYGFQAKLHGGRMASSAPSGRHSIRESAILGWNILRNRFLPGRKRMVPYSIRWLMRLTPAWFRHDLLTLFDLLQQQKIKPLIAQQLPLSERALVGTAHFQRERNGALLRVLAVVCAKVLDTADIVIALGKVWKRRNRR